MNLYVGSVDLAAFYPSSRVLPNICDQLLVAGSELVFEGLSQGEVSMLCGISSSTKLPGLVFVTEAVLEQKHRRPSENYTWNQNTIHIL